MSVPERFPILETERFLLRDIRQSDARKFIIISPKKE